MQNQSNEWHLIEKLLMSTVVEQRRKRRWRTFFLLLFFAYVGVIIYFLVGREEDMAAMPQSGQHTALIKINGPIMESETANANAIIKGLKKAFRSKNAKAVILSINSPGGSPVQAGYVYDEIRRLQAKYPDKKVYAVISDMGASAAYYIASAANEIYANKASLVGSIGVISAGFGYTGLMDKVGVERRVFASGKDKAFLDPFQPLKASEKEFWEASLDVIYKQFIEQVKLGRGDRLKIDENTFSGRIWPGQVALTKGLVDGLGSLDFVAMEIIKAEKIVNYSVEQDPVSKLLRQFSASMVQEIESSLTKTTLPSMSY